MPGFSLVRLKSSIAQDVVTLQRENIVKKICWLLLVFVVLFLSCDTRQQRKKESNSVETVSEPERREYIKVADVEVGVGSIVSEVYNRYDVTSSDNKYMQKNLPSVAEWNHDYMLWSEATRMVVYLDPNKNDDLSEENRIKIDKIKRYIERHPEKSLVIALYVRLTDVFEKAGIPIEQFRAGWHYYHGEQMPPLTYRR